MKVSLKCENCFEKYQLGKDAMCLTSEEMKGMMGAVIGQFPTFLLVSHSKKSATQESLASDEATIMRLGPTRGWQCDKCKFVNRWNPVYSNHIKTEKKTWWRFYGLFD